MTEGELAADARFTELKRAVSEQLRLAVGETDFGPLIRQYGALPDYGETSERRRNELMSLLKEAVDIARLIGDEPPAAPQQALMQQYRLPGYAPRTQQLLLARLNPSDLVVAMLLLRDPQLSDRQALMALLPGDDDSVRRMFTLIRGHAMAFPWVFDKAGGVELKVELLLSQLDALQAVIESDAEEDERKHAQSSVRWNRGHASQKLLLEGGAEAVFRLMDEGRVTVEDVKSCLHDASTDEIVVPLLARCERVVDALFISKYVADPAALRPFIEESGAALRKLPEVFRAAAAEDLRLIIGALEAEPLIERVTPLRPRGRHKFVVGLRDGSYLIAWSSVQTCEYHKDLFRAADLSLSDRFVKTFGSGGKVTVEQKPDGGHAVTFHDFSCDYGRFAPRVLKPFLPQITAAAAGDLGTNVEIIIGRSE